MKDHCSTLPGALSVSNLRVRRSAAWSNTSVVIGGLTHNPAYGPDLGRVEKTLNFNMNMVRVCQVRIKPLHPNERIIVFLLKPKLTFSHGGIILYFEPV